MKMTYRHMYFSCQYNNVAARASSSLTFPILGSPEWLCIFIFHFVLSNTSSSFNPTLSIFLCTWVFPPGLLSSSPSLSWHWWIYHYFSMCPFPLLLTCLYHFSLFSEIFVVTGISFTDPLTCSFMIVSLIVSPFIHLSILISFTSSFLSSLFVAAIL